MQAQLIPEQEPRRQRSFMLVASGAPRDENWAAGRWGCLRVICATQTPPLDSRPVSGYGASLSGFRPSHDEIWPDELPEAMPERSIPESGTCFHSNRAFRLAPAHQGMKSGSCGLVRQIGTVDSATPHPDPSGGQAPRLAKSSPALHFLIPPSTIGLRIRHVSPVESRHRGLDDRIPAFGAVVGDNIFVSMTKWGMGMTRSAGLTGAGFFGTNRTCKVGRCRRRSCWEDARQAHRRAQRLRARGNMRR